VVVVYFTVGWYFYSAEMIVQIFDYLVGSVIQFNPFTLLKSLELTKIVNKVCSINNSELDRSPTGLHV